MGRQDWRTPPALFATLDRRFGPFNLDAAASDGNHMCDRYFTEEDDALTQDWNGRVFVNPPFGTTGDWVRYAHWQKSRGADLICMILLASMCSDWMHSYASRWEIFVPDRRINYWHPGQRPGGFDRDSLIVVMQGSQSDAWRVAPMTIPNESETLKRLHAEANGQLVLGVQC